MLNKIIKKTKKIVPALALAGMAYMPANAKADWGDKVTNPKSEIVVTLGQKNEELMGRPFSKGPKIEMHGKGRLKFNEVSGLKLEGRLNLENLAYENFDGRNQRTELETNGIFEVYFNNSPNLTFKSGFGVDLDFNHTIERIENTKVKSSNITVGPALTGNMDSKYVDFDVLVSAGFGEAGNGVRGRGLAIKPKLQSELDIDLRPVNVPLNLEGIGEIEVTVLETENTSRNEYNLKAGARLNYEVYDNTSITLDYSHTWHYGNQDNVSSDNLSAGLKYEF